MRKLSAKNYNKQMKETEVKQSEPTEQHAQKQIKKGRRYKGRYVLKDGHKVFELDLTTGVIVEATYEVTKNVDFDEVLKGTERKPVRVLVERENCLYMPALNKKNAQKKFKKIFDSVSLVEQ